MARTREAQVLLEDEKSERLEAICQLSIPLPDWDVLEKEIAEAHGSDLLDTKVPLREASS